MLAGAVQDFMVLFVSTRRDGRPGELIVGRWALQSPGSSPWWPPS